jgi:predicted alpha/beta-fold hydrolase
LNRFFWKLGLLAAIVVTFSLRAAEKGDEGDDSNKRTVDTAPGSLPPYKHPYTDGLYSTVVAMNMFYIPNEELEKKIKKQKLKVPGFRKDVQVYASMQDYQAPLLVIILGGDGKADGPWGGLFPYWYSEAGYHVITFDSTFTPLYPEVNGQGVVGNFDAEADQIAQVIAAFLKTADAKKVTTVGVLGLSFGGTQALLLAKKQAEGKLPFELSGCLALCPPIKMKTAAHAVDKFFAEDRWDTTMVELAKKFGAHAPVAEGQKHPFTDSEMRAAIGFVFRDGLTNVVERNDRYYKLKILPSEESGENRKDYAQATGFTRFMEDYTFPYWQKKGNLKTVDDLWATCDLTKILPTLPPWAEAIVAENDPFNSPEDLDEAKAIDKNKNLTVVPTGGHLGFVSGDWALVKALRIFQRKAGEAGGKPGPDVVAPQAPAIDDKRTPDQARKEAMDAVNDALKQDVPPADPKKDDKKKKDEKKKEKK